MRRSIPYIFFTLISLFTFAQKDVTIKGKILDAEDSAALPAAHLKLHENNKGTFTNYNGNFILKGIKPGVYHIHISYVAYAAKTFYFSIEHDTTVLFYLSPSSNELDEVVVESNPLKINRRESSQSIISVDDEYLERNIGNTLTESLEKNPGVNSINMGVGISKPMIRGLSFNRVAVAQQGIKQEGQQWGADHGLEIDPMDVENVEIIKGPSSLAYGSDAMAGVLQIRKPHLPHEGEYEHEFTTVYRTNNNNRGVNVKTAGNKKGFVYRLSGTYMKYADYKVPAEKYTYERFIYPIIDQTLKNTAGREAHFSLLTGINRKWGYSHLTVSNYNQKIGLFSGAIGEPGTFNLNPDGSENIALPRQEINHLKIISNSSISLGKNWLEVDLGFQNNNRAEKSYPHAHGQPVDSSNINAILLRLNTISSNIKYHILKKKTEYVAGIQSSIKSNRSRGFEFIIPNFNEYHLGIYALAKHTFSEKLVLNGGLRGDYSNLTAPETFFPYYRRRQFLAFVQRNPDINRNFWNYSASSGISWQALKELNVKVNLGKSFRTPVTPELTSNGYHHSTFRFEKGSPDLKTEQGYQSDISLNFEAGKFHGYVNGFFNYFKDFIYLDPTGKFPTVTFEGGLYPLWSTSQVHQYNQANALHSGYEAELHYKVMKNLELYSNISYVRGENLEERVPLPFIPPLQLVSGIIFEKNLKKAGPIKSIYFMPDFYYFNEQTRVDRNERETPAAQVWNLSTGAEISLSNKWHCDLSFQVRNLRDAQYYNHLSRYRILNLPEPGRNLIFSLKFSRE